VRFIVIKTKYQFERPVLALKMINLKVLSQLCLMSSLHNESILHSSVQNYSTSRFALFITTDLFETLHIYMNIYTYMNIYI
jgi:hypothetical protein